MATSLLIILTLLFFVVLSAESSANSWCSKVGTGMNRSEQSVDLIENLLLTIASDGIIKNVVFMNVTEMRIPYFHPRLKTMILISVANLKIMC